MNDLPGVSLLPVLPAAHRPASTLPLPNAARTSGGPGPATARSIARRILLALRDLGLDDVVLPGWVSADGATIAFGALGVPAADDLACQLEALAAQVGEAAAAQAAARRAAGAGQATLFGVES